MRNTGERAPHPDTRSAITRAALDCFAENGYEATSIKEIARAANIRSSALIYHYFESKLDLYIACVSEYDDNSRYFEHIDIEEYPDFEAFLNRFLSAYVDIAVRSNLRKLMICGLSSINSNPEVLRIVLNCGLNPMEDLLKRYIARYGDDPAVRAAGRDTRVLLRMLTGPLFLQIYVNSGNTLGTLPEHDASDMVANICAMVMAWANTLAAQGDAE